MNRDKGESLEEETDHTDPLNELGLLKINPVNTSRVTFWAKSHQKSKPNEQSEQHKTVIKYNDIKKCSDFVFGIELTLFQWP